MSNTVLSLATFTQLIEPMRQSVAAFTDAVGPLKTAFRRFGAAVYAGIDLGYREAHPGQRLPKPTKARWRKKREKIVLTWFARQAGQEGVNGPS